MSGQWVLVGGGVIAQRPELIALIDARVRAFRGSAGSHSPQSLPILGTPDEVVGFSSESTALSKALKRHGFAHVGPTTCYSLFQACGFVNDHAVGCAAGDEIAGE